jgi:hypothetical protein
MSQLITYFIECPHDACDGEAETGMTLDLSAADGGPIRINVGLAISQERFVCNRCEHTFYSGDFEDDLFDPLRDDGKECRGCSCWCHEDDGEDPDEDDLDCDCDCREAGKVGQTDA